MPARSPHSESDQVGRKPNGTAIQLQCRDPVIRRADINIRSWRVSELPTCGSAIRYIATLGVTFEWAAAADFPYRRFPDLAGPVGCGLMPSSSEEIQHLHLADLHDDRRFSRKRRSFRSHIPLGKPGLLAAARFLDLDTFEQFEHRVPLLGGELVDRPTSPDFLECLIRRNMVLGQSQ